MSESNSVKALYLIEWFFLVELFWARKRGVMDYLESVQVLYISYVGKFDKTPKFDTFSLPKFVHKVCIQ